MGATPSGREAAICSVVTAAAGRPFVFADQGFAGWLGELLRSLGLALAEVEYLSELSDEGKRARKEFSSRLTEVARISAGLVDETRRRDGQSGDALSEAREAAVRRARGPSGVQGVSGIDSPGRMLSVLLTQLALPLGSEGTDDAALPAFQSFLAEVAAAAVAASGWALHPAPPG